MTRVFPFVLPLLLGASQSLQAAPEASAGEARLRVASYNTSLNDDHGGGLVARLRAGDPKAAKVAAVIQHQRPDLLLLNEFDYDPDGKAASLFEHRYLEKPQHGQQAIRYPYRYFAPVNTGLPSGMDLDHDGKVGGGGDAFGFGLHPGQYGMLVLSRYPIDRARVRTFQGFRWSRLPNPSVPIFRNDRRPTVWQVRVGLMPRLSTV